MMNVFCYVFWLFVFSSVSYGMQTLGKTSHFSGCSLSSRSYASLFEPRNLFPDFNEDQILQSVTCNKEGQQQEVLICNYKHITAFPDNISFPNSDNMKIAVIDSGLNFDLPMANEFNFTDGSRKRAKMIRDKKEQLESHLHTLNVCMIMNHLVPGLKFDIFPIKNKEDYAEERIAGSIQQATEEGNMLINLSLKLCFRHELDTSFCTSEADISEPLRKALLEAKERGVGIILAAGNEKTNIIRRYPSIQQLVEKMEGALLIVYGTAYNWCHGSSYPKPTLVETIYEWSNYCDSWDMAQFGISAPANGIYAFTNLTGTRFPIDGTSFAVPQVTAAAAVIKGLHPHLTIIEIFNLLKKASRENPLFTNQFSYFSHIPGVLHVQNALKLADKEYSLKE